MPQPEFQLRTLREFFFDAMLQGWVGGTTPKALPQLPGFKCYQSEAGPFTLVDAFCVGPSRTWSSGHTTIWYEEQPVWVMNYWGQYPDSVSDFLKSVLKAAYTNKKSIGGRGFASHVSGDDRLVYANSCYHQHVDGCFAECQGYESIHQWCGHATGWQLVGYHHYQCLLLK